MPRLDHVEIVVFAGNHGVAARGVSAYPAEVTAQMVANFDAGGAAINQLARTVGAELRVVPLSLDAPPRDFTEAPAMDESGFLDAVGVGAAAIPPHCRPAVPGRDGHRQHHGSGGGRGGAVRRRGSALGGPRHRRR